MKRNQRQVVEDRWEKKETVGKPPIPDKFKEVRAVPPLQAKTNAQKQYLRYLKECIISVASGHSGCGKSFCASYYAAQLLNAGEIEKIVVTRPYAHLGKDTGFEPGTDAQKFHPFVRPMLDTIKGVLGEGNYNYCIEKEIIEIAPLEKIQGRSFDEDCVILADELQNASKPQLLSLVTRIGEGVKFISLMGDPRQSTSRGENALDWITAFFERNNIEGVGITHFNEEDCVRSGIVRDILIAFEREGGFYNTL